MNVVVLKCSECGATLNIEETRKICFCSYCGTRILLDDGSCTYTHIHIDKTREKELQIEEKKITEEREKETSKVRVRIITAVAVCIAILVSFITFIILRSDFNITFNFCIMIIGCATAIPRFLRKKSSLGTIALAVILAASCIAFIIMRDDFNSTFMMAVVLSVVFHIVASVGKKDKK